MVDTIDAPQPIEVQQPPQQETVDTFLPPDEARQRLQSTYDIVRHDKIPVNLAGADTTQQINDRRREFDTERQNIMNDINNLRGKAETGEVSPNTMREIEDKMRDFMNKNEPDYLTAGRNAAKNILSSNPDDIVGLINLEDSAVGMRGLAQQLSSRADREQVPYYANHLRNLAKVVKDKGEHARQLINAKRQLEEATKQ